MPIFPENEIAKKAVERRDGFATWGRDGAALSISLRSWTVHNLISHPLCEVLYLLSVCLRSERLRRASHWAHDITAPYGHPTEPADDGNGTADAKGGREP